MLIFELTDELVEERHVLQLIHLYLEDVLDLLVGFARILAVRQVVPVPVALRLIFVIGRIKWIRVKRLVGGKVVVAMLFEVVDVTSVAAGAGLVDRVWRRAAVPALSHLRRLQGATRVRSIVDELVEVSKHDVVISLRLEVHLGTRVHVQLFKQREHLPQAQRNTQAFQLVLEQLGVDLFGDQDVSRYDLQVLALIITARRLIV